MPLGCQTGSEDRRQPFNYQSLHYWIHTTMSICSICFVQSCIDHTSYLSGAPGTIVIWRNLSTCQIVRWRNSPHDRLSCGKNLHMRNLFCYDLRAFAWRKIGPWRKKTNIRFGIDVKTECKERCICHLLQHIWKSIAILTFNIYELLA